MEALLGCLAQLYLLLDDPSRVVDERVNQAGDCREKRRTSGRRCGKKKKKNRTLEVPAAAEGTDL